MPEPGAYVDAIDDPIFNRDAKVTDPDAAVATTNSLLRGILEQLQTMTTVLETIAANTEPQA